MLSVSRDEARTEEGGIAGLDDASLWRWFCMMYGDDRIRWCHCYHGWLVSVDHLHLATESDFASAIRVARDRYHSGCRASANRKESLSSPTQQQAF
jgi:hypothetical protein